MSIHSSIDLFAKRGKKRVDDNKILLFSTRRDATWRILLFFYLFFKLKSMDKSKRSLPSDVAVRRWKIVEIFEKLVQKKFFFTFKKIFRFIWRRVENQRLSIVWASECQAVESISSSSSLGLSVPRRRRRRRKNNNCSCRRLYWRFSSQLIQKNSNKETNDRRINRNEWTRWQ